MIVTKKLAKINTKTENANMTQNKRVKILDENKKEPFRLPFASKSMKYGTNIEWNPPSAKHIRKNLGNLKATKKASISEQAPRKCDNAASLTTPKARLITVNPLTVKNFLSMDKG
jgi:ribosomal protein L29